jgi:hypothetical protein
MQFYTHIVYLSNAERDQYIDCYILFEDVEGDQIIYDDQSLSLRHALKMEDDLSEIETPEWLETYCEDESSCTKLFFRFDTYKMS